MNISYILIVNMNLVERNILLRYIARFMVNVFLHSYGIRRNIALSILLLKENGVYMLKLLGSKLRGLYPDDKSSYGLLRKMLSVLRENSRRLEGRYGIMLKIYRNIDDPLEDLVGKPWMKVFIVIREDRQIIKLSYLTKQLKLNVKNNEKLAFIISANVEPEVLFEKLREIGISFNILDVGVVPFWHIPTILNWLLDVGEEYDRL